MTVTWDNVNKIATITGSTEGSPDQLGNIYNAAVAGGGSSNVFAAGHTYQFSDMKIQFNGGCLTIFPFQELFCNRSQITWGSSAGTLVLYYNSRLTYDGDSDTRYTTYAADMLMNNSGAKLKTVWTADSGYEKPQIYINRNITMTWIGTRVASGVTPPATIWDINGLQIYVPSLAYLNFVTSAASPVLDDIDVINMGSVGSGALQFNQHTINRFTARNVNTFHILGDPGAGSGPTFVDPQFIYTSSQRLNFDYINSTPAIFTFIDPLLTNWNGKLYNATGRVMMKNTVERRFYNEAGSQSGIDVRGQFRSSSSTIGPDQDTFTTSGITSTTLTSLDSLATTANAGIETTPTVVTWTEDYHPYDYNESLASRIQTSQSLTGGSESTINLTSVGFTMVSEATAAAYTGIAINHTTQTLTVTSAHTYREIFAYCKQHLRQSANMQYPDFIRTFDGKGFECDYNVVIDGPTLTGEGWLTLTGTKTFTLTNGGALGTGNFATDLNGTYGTGSGSGTGLTIEDIQTALDNQGYTTARATLLDYLDTPVSSREAESSAATRAATDLAQHDATQNAIAALDTADGTAAAVWDYLTADAIAVGSFGMFLKSQLDAAISSRQSEANALTRYNNLVAEHDATQALITAMDIQGDCQDALTAFGYTSTRAAKLDNLDVAVSTRESETSAATRATTNQSEHDATQAAIEAQVVTVDNEAIAAAVWDFLTTDAITTGSFGVLVKTNLDAAVSSREAEVDAATRASTNVTEHNETQNTLAALDFTADVQSALTAQGYTTTRAGKLDFLDAAVSSREAESSAATRFATALNEHDATQAAIDAIDVVLDVKQALTDYGYTSVRAAKLDNLDNLTAAAPTTSEIVIAILDEALAGHDVDGTVGRALRIARDQSTVAANNTQQ